ncbi:MAG: hypothetical protein R3E79_56545 [Caldilineaceae bacterium]
MRLFRHINPSVNPRLCLPILLMLCLLFVAAAWQSPVVYATDETTAPAAQLYLPLIQRVDQVVTPTPTTPTATATPTPAPALAFFPDATWKTSDASTAVDAQGGQHVAFYYYEPKIEQRPQSARYAYCPSQCEQQASWQSVALASDQDVNEVQLRLNGAGKPRLLIRTVSTVVANGNDFYYATCDQDCTIAAGWTLTLVHSNSGTAIVELEDDELPQRSFALDPLGRPRFVFVDRTNSHYGVFYAFCDNDCQQPAAWQQTRINRVQEAPYRDDDFYYPALAFTADGRPRLVTAQFFPMNDGESTLAYFECNAACDRTESWQTVSLALRGGGAEPSADIAVDGAGRPRIAFYQEALLNEQGKRLFYLWCNTDCLDVANWQQRELGLGSFNGQEPDLELDRQGRPRLAYADWDAGGIGLAWCNENCETTAATWEHQLLEDRNLLYSVWPVAYPPHCDGGLWNTLSPTLVLPANGNLQIAYDATYHAHCLYDDDPTDNNPPVSAMHLIVRAARLLSVPLPFALPPDPGTPTPGATSSPTAVTPTPVTPTPVPPTVTPTPVAIPTTLAFFTETRWQTSNTSVAVDVNGGKHMVFYYAEAAVAENPTFASYFYCPGQCEDDANWNGLNFAAQVNEVQLALNAAGKPSLLLRTDSLLYQGGNDYYYATCTGDCTTVAGWSLGYVLSTHGTADVERHDVEQPQRAFALDPDGRPRFVYLDRNERVDPNHIGLFYAFCDSNCTITGQWQAARISETIQESDHFDWEVTLYPTLAFTTDGRPRLLTAEFYPLEGKAATLTYYECNDLCELGYTWGKVQLYERGEGPLPSADLVIDATGHPHVAFYQEKIRETLPGGGTAVTGPHLWYATCPESHCMTAFNWQAMELGLDAHNGGAPDLALDSQGRPRLAYVHGESSGIGYSWCDANCTSYTAHAWQHGVVETGSQVQREWPIDPPAGCAAGEWHSLTPTLALSAMDEVQVAYDAAYIAHCTTDEVLMRTGRLLVFTQP